MSGSGVLARVARRVADVGRVPTAQRAVLGYYAETGTFDARALGLKSEVDSVMDDILNELYGGCERALAEEFGVDEGEVSFTYETKLTLPAELTLGYLFRRARQRSTPSYDPVADTVDEGLVGPLPGITGRPDGTARRQHANREASALVADAREMTAFVVAALLDGDMRDAINDEEFEDFLVTVEGDAPETDPKTVAEVVQSCLQSRVDAGFASYPDGVRAAYDHAVDVSETHQEQDERFRDLMATAARSGNDERGTDASEEARAAIETEYKHRPMADDDHPFTRDELDLPYLTTQYDRVGVIYHGMLEMYRAAGFEIESAFERSIVFAIIGAQVWLDDVDDYHDDRTEGQLTPVTAEYLLAASDRDAFETIVSVSNAYFDHARAYADAADSTLTGIAVEYILYSGDVSHLPGREN
jgi:hypothetical protein